MNDRFLERVKEMASVARPLEQPTREDWANIERDLSLRLPPDFKKLVSELGSGHFGEFSLLNPCSSSDYTRLSRERALSFWRNLEPVSRNTGLLLYPNPNGFLQIGSSGNRMDLLLRPRSVEIYELVWLEQDYDTLHPINLTVSRFLHDLYLNLLTESWGREVRDLIWQPGEPFFTPRKGRQAP